MMVSGKEIRKQQMEKPLGPTSDPYIVCLSCHEHYLSRPEEIPKDVRIIFTEHIDGELTKLHCCKLFRCINQEIKEVIDGKSKRECNCTS
jgi:hypothetical protein